MTLKSYLGKVLITSTLFSISCSNSWAENVADYGVRLYKNGHAEQAREYFETQIKLKPRDAHAHYMLANVFVELRLNAQAKKEYQICVELDPAGAVGQYSRLALSRFDTELLNKAGSHESLKTSVREISSETRQDEQRTQSECDARVAQIYKEADAKVQRLEDEMKEKIADNGEPVYGYPIGRPFNLRAIRAGVAPRIKTYDPSPANADLRAEYNRQIEQIKAQAQEDASRIIAASKEKAVSLEDSALTLDKEYLPHEQNNNVSLAPMGTNMYVRNYQIKQSVSGNPVPLQAEPPRSLLNKTSSSVDSQ